MTGSPSRVSRQARVWIASTLGAMLVRLVAMTWRIQVRGGEDFARCVAERKPAAFVLWHGEMLPLIWYWRRNGIRALISTHSDGEIIARIVEGLGYETVRGSSTREGARALREMIAALRAREQVAVTPDGPRGPRHSFAPGVVVATHRTQSPIILARAHVNRAWVLKSWDRFVVPKPFARVELVHSPLLEPPHEQAFVAEEEADRLAKKLDDLCPDEQALT